MTSTASDMVSRAPARIAKKARPRIRARETEHRILNSLQLVASLLRDSLQTTSCEQSRQEINVAHQRIISVISLQNELYRKKGDIHLDAHFGSIARSIENALVTKDRPLRIAVRCSKAWVDAATATALGLVVTELLINAIKHAYPGTTAGTIRLYFVGDRDDWHLVVSDDGAGAASKPQQGTGSGLVAALAAQLDAKLSIQSGGTGYRTELVRAAH